jgi:hypothetical protein
LFTISEEYATSAFRVEVRMVRKFMCYIVLGGRSGQVDWLTVVERGGDHPDDGGNRHL